MKKLNRTSLRNLILQEIKMITESSFNDAIAISKKNKDKEVYYYDSKNSLVQVLVNGVVEDTIKDVEPGTKKYKGYMAKGKRAVNFDLT